MSSGTPSGPLLHSVDGPKRSAPLRAKVAASSCWCSPSMCTPTYAASDSTGQLEEDVPTPKEISGGSAATEVSEVAVKPTGCSPRR